MKHHPISSIIVGIILIIVGIILTSVALFSSEKGLIFILIYGIPTLLIGIILLVWKKEDEIEQRKDLVKGGKKK